MNKNTSLDELCLCAPALLYEYIMGCKDTPQNPEWHPEGPQEPTPHNVYFHTAIVYSRAQEWGDEDLMMAAFFHDLGKADTTVRNDRGNWSSPDHENVSARLVHRYRTWVEEMGCNYEKVYTVVKNHMRIKREDEMRTAKREKLNKNFYYPDIMKFSEFDDMSTL